MDLNKLNEFVEQVKNTLELNITLNALNEELTRHLELEKNKNDNLVNEQEKYKLEEKNKINQYVEQIKELQNLLKEQKKCQIE